MTQPSLLLVRVTLARLHQSPLCLARALQPPRPQLHSLARALRLGRRERRFALALTRLKTNLWLYRVHQRAFAGDFVVVDMASPDPRVRRVWVLELKQGEPLRWRSTAMHQLKNSAHAVEALVSQGVIATRSPARVLTGDGSAVLIALGVHG